MPHMVVCARYKQEMEGLDEPPFDSDFGHKIYNQVSKKAFWDFAGNATRSIAMLNAHIGMAKVAEVVA